MQKLTGNINKSFYLRLFLFVLLFLFATGITGPFVISSKLLYGFYFFIYGNLGKLVLLSLVAFFLLLYSGKFVLPRLSWSKWHLVYILSGFVLIPIFFFLATQLLATGSFWVNPVLSLATHLILIAIPFLFALGIFSPLFLYTFARKYWKLLALCLGAGVFYDISIFFIWKLWPFLSNIVLQIMHVVFSWTYETVYVIPPRTLFVRNFAVEIAEACSGIDSLYLLLTLYLLIIGIDWKTLDKTKAFLIFIPLFIGAFIANILRVYLLITLGLVFSPVVTYQLFHTYLGLILFLVYFVGFLYFVYPWMKIRKK